MDREANWRGTVGRGRSGSAVNYLFIGWQHVVRQESEIEGEMLCVVVGLSVYNEVDLILSPLLLEALLVAPVLRHTAAH